MTPEMASPQGQQDEELRMEKEESLNAERAEQDEKQRKQWEEEDEEEGEVGRQVTGEEPRKRNIHGGHAI